MNLKVFLLATCLMASLNLQAAPKKVSPYQAIYNQAIQAFNQQDYTSAFNLLKPLADKGDATAQNSLATLYEQGLGVEKNAAEAFKWYEKAAKQGVADAQFEVGFLYAEGVGVAQDYQQAFVWYHKAAKQGHAAAQNNLAMRYASGTGVKCNVKQAKKWFTRAAKQGHGSAIMALQNFEQVEKACKNK